MIPTRYRSKLPRELSHPIGAQELSAALEGVRNFDSLSVCFSDCLGWQKSEFQRILKEKRAYSVVELQFVKLDRPGVGASANLVASGYYASRWELMVNPVPASLRHTAN